MIFKSVRHGQPTLGPIELHGLLKISVVVIGLIELGHARKQIGLVATIDRLTVAQHRQHLPLIQQITEASERRGRPGIVLNTQSLMWTRLRLHSHTAQRLDPIDRRQSGQCECIAPGGVGQNHELRDQYIHCGATTPLNDLRLAVTDQQGLWISGIPLHIKIKVGPARCLRPAAHPLSGLTQAPCQHQQWL